MSVLYLDLPLIGNLTEQKLSAMFDSGATDSCIRESLARQLSSHIEKTDFVEAEGAAGTVAIQIKGMVSLRFRINNLELNDNFFVVPDLTEEAIIGASTMQKYRMKLDFEHDAIELGPRLGKLKIINVKL